MKPRLIFALSLSVAVLISCQCLRMQSDVSSRKVVQIDDHAVLIPGTAISREDRVALDRIFKKYDTSLYRIAVYEKGSLKKQIGAMDEMQMDEVTKEYPTNATASGLSNWTSQIGFRTLVTHYSPTTHVTHPGNTTHVTTGNTTHVTTGNTTHVTTGNTTHVTTGNTTHVTTGNTTHVTTGGDTTHVTTPGRPSHVTRIAEASDALVQEVTPILEKYSK